MGFRVWILLSMAVIPCCPRIEVLFGSLPGISQLPLDLGFSRFIVRDPSAAARFVSFEGISPCCS